MKLNNTTYEAPYAAPMVIFIKKVADSCFCVSTIDSASNEKFEREEEDYLIF